MSEHVVATEEDLTEENRLIVQVKGIEIGIFKIDGDYYAIANWCCHQGGPLCSGEVGGTIKSSFDRDNLVTTTEWIDEKRVISCPWHSWEFDVKTGECLSRKGLKVPSYTVKCEEGEIILTI